MADPYDAVQDARSDRGVWSEGDVADDAAEAFRWGYGEAAGEQARRGARCSGGDARSPQGQAGCVPTSVATMSKPETPENARSAASECEYGCSDGLLYDPRVQGNVVDCPGCKVSRDSAGEEPVDAAVTVRDSTAASPDPSAACPNCGAPVVEGRCSSVTCQNHNGPSAARSSRQ